MNEIPFTQYLRPNGRRKTVSIAVPQDIADKAQKVLDAGYRFECEELTTGQVSLTIFDTVDDFDAAIEVCENGPGVLNAVTSLVNGFDLLRARG